MPPTQGNGVLVADGRWPKPSLGPSRLGGPGPPCSRARKKPSSCNHSGWQRGFRLPIVAVPTSQRASRLSLDPPSALDSGGTLGSPKPPSRSGPTHHRSSPRPPSLWPWWCSERCRRTSRDRLRSGGCRSGDTAQDGPLFATAITHGGKHIRAAIDQTPQSQNPHCQVPRYCQHHEVRHSYGFVPFLCWGVGLHLSAVESLCRRLGLLCPIGAQPQREVGRLHCLPYHPY